MRLRDRAFFNFAQQAERAQQMFIRRIMMIHIELHERDNAAEIGDKTAQDAGFIHAPQNPFRIALGG